MSTQNESAIMRTAVDVDLNWTSAKVSLMDSLSQLVQLFQVELVPQVGGGVSGLVDPMQLMPYAARSANSDDVPDEVLQSMLIPITFYDDMPTIDGTPIWDRLSGETIPYFNAFKVYRDLVLTTRRRSIVAAAEKLGVAPRLLTTLSKVWHWQIRTQAFDQYRKQEEDIERAYRADMVDSRLFKKSTKLLEGLFTYVEENQDRLNPKVANDLIKTLVPILRVSVGLPSNAPKEEIKISNGGSGGSSVNVNINNANGDNAQAMSVHGMSASEVMQKTAEQAKEPSYLAGIINTMIQSGAIENAIVNESQDIDVIDVETNNTQEE